jgi:hypothetical protein
MNTLTPATERKILREMGWEKLDRTTWIKQTGSDTHYINFMGKNWSQGPWRLHASNSLITYHPNILSVLAIYHQ